MEYVELKCRDPNCNHDLSVSLRVAGKTVICPHCGTKNPVPANLHRQVDSASVQPRSFIHCTCGKKLLVKGTDAKLVQCPACGAKHRVHANEAHQARKPLFDDEDLVPVTPKKSCPSCGKLFERNVVLCVDCGYNFMTGEKLERAELPEDAEALDEEILRPSLVSSAIFSIVSAALSVGVWVVASPPNMPDGAAKVFVWILEIAFTITAIFTFSKLFPNGDYLRLTRHGITIRCFFVMTTTLKWHEIERFKVHVTQSRNGSTEKVVLDLSPSHPRRGGWLRREVGGDFDLVLPDKYGMHAGELAVLLEVWRQRFSAFSLVSDAFE